MRLSLPTHHLAGPVAALALACTTSLLIGPGSASAAFPGGNGLIATYKCDDGSTCSKSHIWTLDPVSGAQHQLTSGPDRDLEPSVSPDGGRIVFTRCPVGLRCQIEIMNSDGSGATALTDGSTNGADDGMPSFSPDGSRIVFEHPEPAHHLYVMNADGSGRTQLTSGSVEDYSAVFSPDGSSIVFSRYANGQPSTIYRMPASGGTPTLLTSGTGAFAPDFSPDSSHIVYDSYDGGIDKVMIMDANGANPHALTSPAPNTGDDEPQFSPDGTQIAYTHYDDANATSAPIMLMNADGSNAHALSAASDYAYATSWQPLPPPPAAATAPAAPAPASLTLRAPKKESVRKGRVYLFATSSKPMAGAANGKVAVGKSAKSYRLRPTSKALTANIRTKISLQIPRKTLRAVRHALARHESARATLAVRVKDSAGNTTSKKLKVRLTK